MEDRGKNAKRIDQNKKNVPEHDLEQMQLAGEQAIREVLGKDPASVKQRASELHSFRSGILSKGMDVALGAIKHAAGMVLPTFLDPIVKEKLRGAQASFGNAEVLAQNVEALFKRACNRDACNELGGLVVEALKLKYPEEMRLKIKYEPGFFGSEAHRKMAARTQLVGDADFRALVDARSSTRVKSLALALDQAFKLRFHQKNMPDSDSNALAERITKGLKKAVNG